MDDMPGIQSQVTFSVGGGGATIGVGPVDAAAAKVEVQWGNALVYSSLTPNLPEQSAISASVTNGQSYALKVTVFAADRSTKAYSGSYTAAAGTIVVKLLNLV